MINYKSQPQISYVKRRSRVHSYNIKKVEQRTSSSTIAPPLNRQKPINIEKLLQNNDDVDIGKTNLILTPFADKLSTLTPEINNLQTAKQSAHGSKQSFKQRTTFKIVILLLVLIVTAAVVIPSVYFFVIRQPNENVQSSFSNISASICSTTTCIGKETPYKTSMITYLYPFDSNTNDLTGYGTGVPSGTASISYNTNCYIGSSALSLNGPSNPQYIQIPYVNISHSFTIEAWIYPSSTQVPEYGIFSQCDSNSNCVAITLRNGHLIFTLDAMNIQNNSLISSTYIYTSDWIHMAVVYDASLYQQLIYTNGRIDAISNYRVKPYQGTSAGITTTIARSVTFAYGVTYFQGRIDHFTISAGVARSICQIYNDASLLAYFPFNTLTVYHDYSVNLFHGITVGTTTINQGPVGEALYFSSSISHFQSKCFSNFEYSNQPFSFALWVNPDSLTGGGSLIHASNWQNGSGSLCYDVLALTSTGAIVAQIMPNSVAMNATQGPVLPANTWTHVAMVFNTNYGIRIYINGQLTTVSIGFGMSTIGFSEPQYITLGNSSPLGPSGGVNCRSGTIPFVSGPFKGGLDEFRLYNRELDSQEICILANK